MSAFCSGSAYRRAAAAKAAQLAARGRAVVLAIETSCDETAAAVVEDGRRTLGAAVLTQIDMHKAFGGVVPEIASRQHVLTLDAVVDEALARAGLTLPDVDAIGVTAGPGLVGALLCGVSWAKGAAMALDKPLLACHHIAGHVCANALAKPDLSPPFCCLIVSGGHTQVVAADDWTSFRVLARTRDDAAGEAFDKAARTLGLPYPGGPAIDQAAQEGDERALTLPRPRTDDGSFSFSGLKTALSDALRKNPGVRTADAAASFRRAVVDSLVSRTLEVCRESGLHTLCMAGGVCANRLLRSRMAEACEKAGLQLIYPPPELCTDNAEMIGVDAFHRLMQRNLADLSLNAVASWPLA